MSYYNVRIDDETAKVLEKLSREFTIAKSRIVEIGIKLFEALSTVPGGDSLLLQIHSNSNPQYVLYIIKSILSMRHLGTLPTDDIVRALELASMRQIEVLTRILESNKKLLKKIEAIVENMNKIENRISNIEKREEKRRLKLKSILKMIERSNEKLKECKTERKREEERKQQQATSEPRTESRIETSREVPEFMRDNPWISIISQKYSREDREK